MPKPSEYTPGRRRALQVVMWAILAGTVGLAAVVGSANRRANRVELSPQGITSGDITVRLPVGWRAQLRSNDDPGTIAQADEPSESREYVRRLTVRFEHLPAPASPVQYLIDRFRLPIDELTADDPIAPVIPATLAGQPGAVVVIDSLLLGVGTPALPQKDVYAAAVLPSQRAVVLHLRGFGRPDLTDRMLVEQIGAAITVNNEPTLSDAPATVTLPGGTTLATPEGLTVVEPRDPLRSDRRLWPRPVDSASIGQCEAIWTSVELVGCLFPAPADEEAARSAFLTLLLTRDPGWRDATITRDEPGTWRAEKPSSHGAIVPFPSRAYLLADGGGQALLAIFRGGFDGGVTFDSYWKLLASSVRFGPAPPVKPLEARGANAAARLARAGYESLIHERTEQWWLWTDGSDRPHRAWSHLDFDLAGGEAAPLRAHGEMRFRRDRGGVTRLAGKFHWRDAGPVYQSDVTRSETGVGETPRSVRQVTTLRDGRLAVTLSAAERTLAQWQAPAPPAFVPGELLPLVMDKLFTADADEPMIVHSESFPDFEALGAPQPLTILVRPFKNEARRAEGEDQPMRCVEAEVNGSGVVTRWYFRRSGAVECIDFPSGLQRTPIDPTAIRFAFDSPPMAPP